MINASSYILPVSHDRNPGCNDRITGFTKSGELLAQPTGCRSYSSTGAKTDSDGLMSEASHTLIVNAHDVLIALAMKAQPNELLAIKNWNTAEEKQSRVVRVGEAETASQNEVAIEFTEPAPRFWHIDFPPADWKYIED